MRIAIPLKQSYYKLKFHRRQANKTSLSSHDKLVIKNEFRSWLLGIEEDDQLPYEISCICLCFEFNQKAVNVSVSGFENMPPKIDKGSYTPLEAQYFFCELLNAYQNNKTNLNSHGTLLEKVKQNIFDLFENFFKSFQREKEFSFLNNKKIIIGEFLHDKTKSFRFICA